MDYFAGDKVLIIRQWIIVAYVRSRSTGRRSTIWLSRRRLTASTVSSRTTAAIHSEVKTLHRFSPSQFRSQTHTRTNRMNSLCYSFTLAVYFV